MANTNTRVLLFRFDIPAKKGSGMASVLCYRMGGGYSVAFTEEEGGDSEIFFTASEFDAFRQQLDDARRRKDT